jgi:hypothetical protein
MTKDRKTQQLCKWWLRMKDVLWYNDISSKIPVLYPSADLLALTISITSTQNDRCNKHVPFDFVVQSRPW